MDDLPRIRRPHLWLYARSWLVHLLDLELALLEGASAGSGVYGHPCPIEASVTLMKRC